VLGVGSETPRPSRGRRDSATADIEIALVGMDDAGPLAGDAFVQKDPDLTAVMSGGTYNPCGESTHVTNMATPLCLAGGSP